MFWLIAALVLMALGGIAVLIWAPSWWKAAGIVLLLVAVLVWPVGLLTGWGMRWQPVHVSVTTTEAPAGSESADTGDALDPNKVPDGKGSDVLAGKLNCVVRINRAITDTGTDVIVPGDTRTENGVTYGCVVVDGTPVPTYNGQPASAPAEDTSDDIDANNNYTETAKTGVDRNGIPLVWMHLEEEFESAGDLVQTFNVDHDGLPRVTISWFHARSGGMTSSDPGPCFMHVTTDPQGERITTQGAKRTWQWVGTVTPTVADIQGLVNAWKNVIEHEVRGTCPAYTVTWQEAEMASNAVAPAQPSQNPATKPPVAPETPTPAASKTAAKAEFVQLDDRFTPTGGKLLTQKVKLAAGEYAIVWYNANKGSSKPAQPFTAIVLKGASETEMTFEGAYRVWKWTGDSQPTKDQLKAHVDAFVKELSKDGNKWEVTFS